MNKIPINELSLLWQQQGVHGAWREALKTGYAPGEVYFEFGVMPEKDRRRGDYRIVLDHEVHVWLAPANIQVVGEYVIRPDSSKAGKQEVDASHQCHTLFVTDSEYTEMIRDASSIYEEYKHDQIVSFWSIPNKWFNDLRLVQFLTNRIVLTEDYRNRTRTRQDWYWP